MNQPHCTKLFLAALLAGLLVLLPACQPSEQLLLREGFNTTLNTLTVLVEADAFTPEQEQRVLGLAQKAHALLLVLEEEPSPQVRNEFHNTLAQLKDMAEQAHHKEDNQ